MLICVTPTLVCRYVEICLLREGSIKGLPASLTQALIHATILDGVGFISERELVTRVLAIDERVPTERTRISGGSAMSSWTVIGCVYHRFSCMVVRKV